MISIDYLEFLHNIIYALKIEENSLSLITIFPKDEPSVELIQRERVRVNKINLDDTRGMVKTYLRTHGVEYIKKGDL